MTLDDLRGKHTGKCAIILGAGPSLQFADERICKGRVSIALNDAIIKFPNSDYYLTMDPTMVDRRHWPVVLGGSFPCILKKDAWDGHGGYAHMVGKGKDLSEDRTVLVEWKPDDMTSRSYKVSRDDQAFIVGGSSAHSAVNFAVILGCETIYLVGCDCRLDDDGRRYFWQYEGQQQFIGGMVYQDPAFLYGYREPNQDDELVKYVGAGWRELRNLNPGITIVDASGGVLSEVFLTATIDELQNG